MDHQRSKTVLILDHSSFFTRPSGVTFNVNVQNNDQQQPDEINNENTIGMKSLWTCIVECVLEYCRILFDIFEDDALVRIGFSFFSIEILFELDYSNRDRD